jgi:ATP-dependent phosphofructokinase / diphosphate-dependent phosphofructokinase
VRIGISTGGGDCPGLNAVIRGFVKRAIGTYQMEVVGITDSFNGLMNRPIDAYDIGLSDVRELLSKGGTILGTTNKGNPFSFVDPEQKIPCDRSKLVLEAYNELKLDAMVVIGGDGTQGIAHQLAALGMNIVGIPKTIDNDLAETDETVGFQTAVEIVADATARLQTTAESHDRIMVLEVMGRDAGHIALHAGIAGGANVILLPEIPFDYKKVVEKIEQRKALGRYFTIIVVSEGAFEKTGGKVTFQSNTSSNETVHLGGIGAIVAQRLHEMTGFDSRYTVLGHVQRGGSPCYYDRVLASAYGVFAADLVHQKKYGHVVVKSQGAFKSVHYTKVAGRSRPVSLDDQLITTAEGLGIHLGR